MNPIDFSSQLDLKAEQIHKENYQQNLKVFGSHGIDISSIDPKFVSGLKSFQIKKLISDIKNIENFKKAYPNYNESYDIPGEHNLNRWLDALKNMMFQNNNGINWKVAFDRVTKDWNDMEKSDFNNWIKFHQSGSHLKYKVAGFYDNGDVGYVLPIEGADSKHNVQLHSDADSTNDNLISSNNSSNVEEEKKKQVEKQRKKIISRLDSVEKLLRSDDGALFTDAELESLMETIYSLKKKISVIKKKHANDTFFEDLIIREANFLSTLGFFKAASFLIATADESPATSPPAAAPADPAAAAPAAPAPEPTTSVGNPGATPAVGGPAAGSPPGAPPVGPQPNADGTSNINAPPVPPLPGTDPASMPPPPAGGAAPTPGAPPPPTNKTKGLQGFLSNLDVSGDKAKKQDVSKADDTLEVDDMGDDLYVDDDFLITHAQDMTAAPAPAAPVTDIAAPPPAEIEVDETEVPQNKVGPMPQIQDSGDKFDNIIDNALNAVKIEDVVRKLEEIAKVFKTREIPRQLSMVDMMLDKLGLISFFPNLSEATNKALESNNYILTRIEEIHAQLSGAMKTREIDLIPSQKTQSPEVMNVSKNLQDSIDKDKARKEMRKELADKAMEERAKEESPDIEVTEDEMTPEEMPPAQPAPAAAPTAPIPPAV